MTAQKISVNWAYGWRKGEEVKGKAGIWWGQSWCCLVYYWSAAAPHPPSKPFQFPTLFIISNSPSHSLPLPVQLVSVSHTTWHETKCKKGGSEDWKPPHQTHTHTHAEKLKEAVTEREVNMISFLLFWALWFHMSTDSTWRFADDQIKSRLNAH